MVNFRMKKIRFTRFQPLADMLRLTLPYLHYEKL